MAPVAVSYNPKRLFAKASLVDTLKEQFSKLVTQVGEIPKEQFLSSSDEQIFEYVFSKLEVNPIVLHENKMHQGEPEETLVSAVPRPSQGFRIVVTIPYSGDHRLWDLRPSQFLSTLPTGEPQPAVRNNPVGYLNITLQGRSTSPPDGIERDFRRNLDEIKSYLDFQRSDIEKHNKELARRIHRAIENRRRQLKKLGDIVERLNIPLERRNDAPKFLPLEERRKVVPTLSSAPKQTSEPWYGISDEIYSHILSVIRHEGTTFETTPCTYFVHDEEGLRDIILAHLNGHYEGAATGETFRRKGKTDIRIEEKHRSAFVAECKIWCGPKKLSEAIDQLLGYTTWRDCKAAMIIFNKHNTRFADLLQKVPEVFAAHPSFRSDQDTQNNGEWRYIFASPNDELQKIFIHVFLFNLYTDGACLTGANLRNADLREADLRGTNLTGARHDEHTRWPDGVRCAKETSD